MMLSAILFDISRATDAGTLHQYRADAAEEITLADEERAEINRAIDARFSFLNLQAGDKPKPRW